MILQEKIKKAELYEANSNWEEAITLYNEIVKEDNSVQNIEKLGWCLSRAGKYDEAIRYFIQLGEKRT
ncbi:MAG: tetratricopeptide repeat protein [Clostridia bacterium]